MKKLLLATVAWLALSTGARAEQVTIVGLDSGTGAKCIVSTTSTCQVPTTGSGGGGGGGAVTVANGADITQGNTADAACAGDNTSGCSIEQRLQRIAQRLTTLNTTLGTPFQAGGSVVGPTPNGSPAANPPLLMGGTSNGTATGNVGNWRVDGAGNGSVNISQINGAAPSITNPVWIANSEAADTTGTFTNGTQTNSVTNSNADGYATGLLSINGTYSTASGVFEESDDGGTTFYSIICTRSDGSATETGYSGLTNTNRQWSCPVAGNDAVRVRSTAVASGTVNVRVGISAPTNSSGVISGAITSNAPSVTTAHTCSVAGYTRDGCLGQIDDDVKGAIPTGTNAIGNLIADTHAQCSALCSSLVVKGSAGTLKTFQIAADATLSGAAWEILIFDTTSAPADGAVTPTKCYPETSGTLKDGGNFSTGGTAFTVGITIVASTGNNCLNKIASAHAFIGADFQ